MKDVKDMSNIRNIEVRIEVGEVSGYAFYADGNPVQWPDLTREEQVRVLGAMSSGYAMFEHFVNYPQTEDLWVVHRRNNYDAEKIQRCPCRDNHKSIQNG